MSQDTVYSRHRKEGHDGLVRKVRVKVNKVESIKAINHLYPLEARAEEAIERYRKSKGMHKFEYKGKEPDTQNNQEKNQDRILRLRSNKAGVMQV